MQKQLLFLVLTTVVLNACQPSATTSQKPFSPDLSAQAHVDSAAVVLPELEEPDAAFQEPSPFTFQQQLLAREERDTLLSGHDLASLWMMEQREGGVVFNGFYGPDHYRIEICFSSITRDSLQPQQFHVTGKSRYKKNITPFIGLITVDSVSSLQVSRWNTDSGSTTESWQQYLAVGQFSFQEDSATQGSGAFTGKMLMDFGLNEKNNLRLYYQAKTPARLAGFLFEGEWRSYKTGKNKPVLWADNFFAIADDVLENFNIGERDVEINPKYRHLGWDTFWSEEEWWNESKPVLQ